MANTPRSTRKLAVLDDADTPPEAILIEAYELITGDRRDSYGDAVEQFETIAAMYTLLTKEHMTAEHALQFMRILKMVRGEYNPDDPDNDRDEAGYTGLRRTVVVAHRDAVA